MFQTARDTNASFLGYDGNLCLEPRGRKGSPKNAGGTFSLARSKLGARRAEQTRSTAAFRKSDEQRCGRILIRTRAAVRPARTSDLQRLRKALVTSTPEAVLALADRSTRRAGA